MRKMRSSLRVETNLAKSLWGEIGDIKLRELRERMSRYRLSVSLGDVTYIDRRLYVTHSGLLRLASRRRCCGIKTTLQKQLSDSVNNRWVFKAVVYKSPGSTGFFGYGDADPTNTSPLVRGAEMRVAETRAVNRALRKAYGIGLCSVEELGWLTNSPSPPARVEKNQTVKPANSNGSSNGQPKLRDRLCMLIRQHELDPILIKAYAADFCGAPTLKEASRDRVESFISHLGTAAKENRDGLVCKLNSYAQPAEVKL
jgi:hypothetical protein